MTVCIAAICQYDDGTYIVGCADTLVTYGDTEFQSPHPKIHQFTQFNAVMTSGDVDVHREAIDKTKADLLANKDQGVSLPVRYVADLYAAHLTRSCRKFAEAEAFGPLGLTVSDFLEKQRNGSLSSDLANHLFQQFQRSWPVSDALVIGRDNSGVHLFLIDQRGRVSSKIDAGYAAIGTGSRHVETHMMFNQHSPQQNLTHTLFRIYLAKRIAESAPGVGASTDICFVGPYSFSMFDKQTHETLSAWYTVYQEAVAKTEEDNTETLAKVLRALWNTQRSSSQSK